MGRQVKEDPTTFKYGQPLFSAVWPRGDCVFVGGGGGNTKSGIESRVVAANFTDGKLSDEIGSVRLKNTIEQLAMSPTSRLLLVATGKGITAFDVDLSGGKCSFVVPQVQLPCRLASRRVVGTCFLEANRLLLWPPAALRPNAPIASQAPVLEALNRLADVAIQVVRFAHDGSVVVFGDATGCLRIWDGATLTERQTQQLTVEGEAVHSEVKDLDAEGGGARVVVTCDTGSAYLWDVSSAGAVELPKPRDLKACAVKHCRFVRSDAGDVLCSMNYRGDGCVGRWRRGDGGALLYHSRSKKFNSITGMDVSPDGAHVGIATADGEAFLLDAGTLAVRKAVKKAHMIFATSVAFAGDSHAFVSTSGDASARVVELPPPQFLGSRLLLLLIALIAALVLAYAFM